MYVFGIRASIFREDINVAEEHGAGSVSSARGSVKHFPSALIAFH